MSAGRSTDTLTVRLPRREAEAFREFAARRGEPVNPILREAIRQLLGVPARS